MSQVSNFTFYQRDTNHWDITIPGKRIYRIRGEEGSFELYSDDGKPYKVFKTLSSCVLHICETLML